MQHVIIFTSETGLEIRLLASFRLNIAASINLLTVAVADLARGRVENIIDSTAFDGREEPTPAKGAEHEAILALSADLASTVLRFALVAGLG